ncbi:MAG: hypothetical protein R6V53_05360 [Candidatus Woesearchaeota archaeon]
MGRGRPNFSQVRVNMIEILAVKGSAYGYELAKIYLDIFPKVTRRLFYYHLKKGLELEEFRVDRVEREEGEYSWGNSAEKTYYALGKNANPRGDQRVKDYFTSS